MVSIERGLPGIKDRDSGINYANGMGIPTAVFQRPSQIKLRACPQKEKPILKRVKDGKKIAMKKKINIGVPISSQIYIFYFNGKGIFIRRTYP
jgi:hypothetical protein